jgi:hypothetical protein
MIQAKKKEVGGDDRPERLGGGVGADSFGNLAPEAPAREAAGTYSGGETHGAYSTYSGRHLLGYE